MDESPHYNAVLIGREEVNPLLHILRVQSEIPLFAFKPGQFAVLGLLGKELRVPEASEEDPVPDPDKLIRRAYSIASSSMERGYLEFYVTLVPSGALSPRLFALPYGSRLFLGAKAAGLFTLDRVAPGKALILIATGTGLAPYMSMLRTLLVNEASRPVVVLHGARYSWDLGYRGELESLARIRPNFTYIPSITRPTEDCHFRGSTGRIQSLVKADAIRLTSGVPFDPAQADVFLCGNPEMIESVKEQLLPLGYTLDRGKEMGTLHVEEYW